MVQSSYMGRGDLGAVRVTMEINGEVIEESKTDQQMDRQNKYQKE